MHSPSEQTFSSLLKQGTGYGGQFSYPKINAYIHTWMWLRATLAVTVFLRNMILGNMPYAVNRLSCKMLYFSSTVSFPQYPEWQVRPNRCVSSFLKIDLWIVNRCVFALPCPSSILYQHVLSLLFAKYVCLRTLTILSVSVTGVLHLQ